MNKAYIKEIFYSIQGEGMYAGKPQCFVRFSDCNLECPYCDTDHSHASEPLTVVEVVEKIEALQAAESEKIVSLTGGEPLLQKEFLQELLPRLREGGYKIFLETNGTLVEELSSLIKYIDIIAMDIKLHLLNSEKYVGIHKEFLKIASQKEVFVKLIIDAENEKNIHKAINIVSEVSFKVPVFFQPVAEKPMFEDIAVRQKDALEELENVRIVPQLHKTLGLK